MKQRARIGGAFEGEGELGLTEGSKGVRKGLGGSCPGSLYNTD